MKMLSPSHKYLASVPSPLQTIALTGLLGMSASACRDTRTDVKKTVASDPVGGPSKIEPPLVNIAPMPPKTPKVKIVIGDNTVNEGFKKMAELAPGRTWAGKLEGNGGRDVMIYIPVLFDEFKDYELVFFFHGTNGSTILPPTVDLSGTNFGKFLPRYDSDEPCLGTRALNQVMGAVEKAETEGSNQILVYPLSEIARGTKVQEDGGQKKQDLQWMRPGNSTHDSMWTLNEEAQKIIRNQMGISADANKLTIKGHSAGGAPLGNILQSGFPADRVDYLDATYWPYSKPGLQGAYKKAMEVNPEMEINIFVHYLGQKTDRASAMILCDRRGQLKPGVLRINATGVDEAGRKITHGKMMRNFWNWQRGEGELLDCP